MTAYLWIAEQTEPGHNRATYALTLTEDPPDCLGPVFHSPGLAFAESLFGDWELLGTVAGVAREELVYGEKEVTVLFDGWPQSLTASEVARLGMFERVTA